jgi:uncharacterized membrane protein YhaH (DUF805 family)
MGILILLLLFIVIPVAAVWTENTEKRAKRKVFGVWMVAVLALSYLFGSAMPFVGRIPDPNLIFGVALFVLAGLITMQVLFFRVLVRRVRDAGHRKSLAYLCLVPMANLGLILYLAFKGSAPIHSDAG